MEEEEEEEEDSEFNPTLECSSGERMEKSKSKQGRIFFEFLIAEYPTLSETLLLLLSDSSNPSKGFSRSGRESGVGRVGRVGRDSDTKLRRNGKLNVFGRCVALEVMIL